MREQAMQEAQDSLQKDWGAAYQKHIHLGNAAIEQGTNGNQEFKDRIVEKFGNDPDFIRFAASLGGRFAEHGVVTTSNSVTPVEIQSQINELMRSDAYTNGRNPDHKATVARVKQLFEAKSR
jgi:hypothetical protein